MGADRPAEPRAQATLCPYCGHVSGSPAGCRVCGGRFDPLSRQATQNTMGPWFVRDESNPHLPGCSYETLKRRVQRGKVGRASIIRGPTTRQFWVIAVRVPGVAHLLGECHNCRVAASPNAAECDQCGVSFLPDIDRQHLGLAQVHLLPGQATPEQIAQSTGDHVVAAREADVESPAHAAVIDEIVETTPEPRRGRAGKVALGLVLVLLCAGLGWMGYWRGVFSSPSAEAEPVVTQAEAAPVAPEPGPEVDAVEEARAPTQGPAHLTLLGLLRNGRVEAARDMLEESGKSEGPAFEVLERRAERDRIRAFLTG